MNPEQGSVDLVVTPDAMTSPKGRVQFGDLTFPCALGRAGVTLDKREGDHKTPIGCFAMRKVYHRPDRIDPPRTVLPVTPITPHDGWCDDPAHARYNRHVALPFDAGHERMWRDDGIYDLIVVLGHNDDPPVPGRGSAIFLHVARPDLSGTEGCVALARDDLLTVLKVITPGSRIDIRSP